MRDPDRAALPVEGTRRHRLRTILEYVRGIHHHIDPDRFLVDLDLVEHWLTRLAAEGYEDTSVTVDHRQLLLLETAVEAAATYAERRGFPPIAGVDDDDCLELLAWLSAENSRLFGRPPTVH